MKYLWLYIVTSVVIGLVQTVYVLYNRRPTKETFLQAKDRFLDEKVEEGHLQKEAYGERNVYYRNNMIGEASIRGAETVEKLLKENYLLYTIFLLIIGTVLLAVTWPKELLSFAHVKIRGR